MQLDRFFDSFELFDNAPKGIPQLRELILQIAVQGKLVKQDPNDDPASILLDHINAENHNKCVDKPNDFQTKKLNSRKSHIPYALPDCWEWVTFEKCFDIQGGTQPPKKTFVDRPQENYVRLYQIRDFGKKPVPTYVHKDSVRRFCTTDDVMLARYGASVGKIFMGQNGAYNVALSKVVFNHQFIYNRFVFFLLKSFLFQKKVLNISRSAQAGFNKGDLANIPLPLPPLPEQHRIVEKVDSLMKLCDELEEKQSTRKTARIALNTAALDSLLSAKSAPAFNKDWHRIRDNFDLLYDRPETVTKLRQSILQLAVQGKLVEQDPNDEPALVLLEKIKAEKERLIKDGLLLKTKLLPLVEKTGLPFELPNQWAYDRLGHIAGISTGFAFKSADYVDEGVFILRVTNIRSDSTFDLSKSVFILPKNVTAQLEKYYLNDNDVLVVMVGGSLGKIGVVTPDILPALLNQNMWRIVPLIKNIDHRFLVMQLRDINSNRLKITNSTHGHLTMTEYKNQVIPLPPLAEQHRIVARVDSLMKHCDELETKLKQSQSDSEILMTAMINNILEK